MALKSLRDSIFRSILPAPTSSSQDNTVEEIPNFLYDSKASCVFHDSVKTLLVQNSAGLFDAYLMIDFLALFPTWIINQLNQCNVVAIAVTIGLGIGYGDLARNRLPVNIQKKAFEMHAVESGHVKETDN